MLSSFLRKAFLPIICLFLITACSSNEEQTEQKEVEEQPVEEEVKDKEQNSETIVELESQDLPKNLEEIIAYPIGPFSSDEVKIQDEDVQNELSAIPALSESANEEDLNQLFSYLYSLFKKDYQDPKQVITSSNVNGPDSGENQNEATTTFNVEIILDSSGSMANYMGSKTRMDLAKESIKKFASSLPEEANISLRVYGHKGTGSDADKKMSCSANELVYSPQPYNQTKLDQALNSFKPAGWTPLAQAILEAQKDLSQYKGEQNKNIVYVVSDGIETCDGDPISAAKSLKDSGVAPVVNIIGFDLKSSDQKQLEDMAVAAGGTYTNVKNQDQLKNEFEKTIKESQKWIQWKSEQTTNVVIDSNLQIKDILGITDKWAIDNTKEKAVLISSLFELQKKKKITNDQTNQLIEKIEGFYSEQTRSVDELEKALLNATNEDLNTTLDKIDEIYDQNVSH